MVSLQYLSRYLSHPTVLGLGLLVLLASRLVMFYQQELGKIPLIHLVQKPQLLVPQASASLRLASAQGNHPLDVPQNQEQGSRLTDNQFSVNYKYTPWEAHIHFTSKSHSTP